MKVARLPGVVRPGHERPPRRPPPGARPSSTASSSPSSRTPARRPCSPPATRVARPPRGRSTTPASPAGRVDVATFDGLTVDAVRAHGARSIVRGLRASPTSRPSCQLAHNNRALAAGRRHGLLHDRRRARLRQLEPGQGDRLRSAATSRTMVPPAAAAALAAALGGRSVTAGPCDNPGQPPRPAGGSVPGHHVPRSSGSSR